MPAERQPSHPTDETETEELIADEGDLTAEQLAEREAADQTSSPSSHR